MDIDTYADLDSPIHAWDPRLKISLLGLFVLVAAACDSAFGLLLMFGTAVILTACSRLPLHFILRALRYPLLFVIIMLPVLILSSGGSEFAKLGPISFYKEGWQAGTAMGVRAVSMMLLMVVIFSTSRLQTTFHALQRLHVPPALIHILLFTYRYIFLYLEDIKMLKNAARLRGFSLSRGIRHIKTSAALIVVLLIRSFDQSERVAAAMRLRGFDGTFRTRQRFSAGFADLAKAGAVGLIGMLLIIVESI